MNEINNQPDQDTNKEQTEPDNEPEKQPSNPDKQPSYSEKTVTPVISPVAAAFIGLIGGFFLYQIVGGLLSLVIFGFDLKNPPVDSLRLMTAGGQILFILLPALIFSKIFYEDVGTIIRAKVPDIKEIALFLAGIIILAPLLQSYLYIQNYFIEIWARDLNWVRQAKLFFDSMNEMVDKSYASLLTAHSVFEALLVVVVVSVIPALCEEVMFRGYIQKSFEFKMKPVWAALITAVFFGAYHFNPYGLIPLIAMGFYFGYAAYTTNSIVVPIILHFFNNFLAVIGYFFSGEEDLIKSNPNQDAHLGTWVIVFFILLLIFSGIVFTIKRYYSKPAKD